MIEMTFSTLYETRYDKKNASLEHLVKNVYRIDVQQSQFNFLFDQAITCLKRDIY